MKHIRIIEPLNKSFECVDGRLLGPDYRRPGAPLPMRLSGAAAHAEGDGSGRFRLVRDPLGINKLFWALGTGGVVLLSSRPLSLIEVGCRFEEIRSIPPGTVVDLDFRDGSVRVQQLEPDLWETSEGAPTDPGEIATGIRRTLDRYASELARENQGRQVYVCLSGGLDSTAAMLFARRHFSRIVAVSFDLVRGDGTRSEDRLTAERLARDFGLPLLRVDVTPDELLKNIDTVLTDGIDWRDFNVHAGLINAAMASSIREAAAEAGRGDSPLVLTGDLMNEFLADYHQETYRGRAYYRLPPLTPGRLRKVLVRGAETSHREVGIFEAWGLDVVQLYAAAARLYLRLPEEFLGDGEGKHRLNALLLGNDMPSYVMQRVKTRAQVGDSGTGRGVLALVIDRGMDRAWLTRRFATLHRVSDPAALDSFIRAGRYRSGIPRADAAPEVYRP